MPASAMHAPYAVGGQHDGAAVVVHPEVQPESAVATSAPTVSAE